MCGVFDLFLWLLVLLFCFVYRIVLNGEKRPKFYANFFDLILSNPSRKKSLADKNWHLKWDSGFLKIDKLSINWCWMLDWAWAHLRKNSISNEMVSKSNVSIFKSCFFFDLRIIANHKTHFSVSFVQIDKCVLLLVSAIE